MIANRSTRPETRNPLLHLPSAKSFADELPEDARRLLRKLLMELSKDAQVRAQESWRRHKAPMAVYWKAVAVYSRHIARLLSDVTTGK
jgi:hypothetical protein